jgi:hypothetical protein
LPAKLVAESDIAEDLRRSFPVGRWIAKARAVEICESCRTTLHSASYVLFDLAESDSGHWIARVTPELPDEAPDGS